MTFLLEGFVPAPGPNLGRISTDTRTHLETRTGKSLIRRPLNLESADNRNIEQHQREPHPKSVTCFNLAEPPSGAENLRAAQKPLRQTYFAKETFIVTGYW